MTKVVISNLPADADFGWVTEQMARMLGEDIVIEQVSA